jgi:hypothetical protein
MIVEVKDHPPETRAPGGRIAKPPPPEAPVAPAGDSRIDEMSECSFPASDPPSAWTWEVRTQTSTPEPTAQH